MSAAAPAAGALPAAPAAARGAAAAGTGRAIEVARVLLVVGLVCLHYFSFPNLPVPAFSGVVPGEHALATAVTGFLSFFFFSAVPLLSAISGWLFLDVRGDPRAVLARRIRGRVGSLLVPLATWNAAYVLAGALAFALGTGGAVLAMMGLDPATATPKTWLNAVLGLTRPPAGFQFWFVRDLFVTALVSPLLWLALARAPLAGAVVLGAGWLAGFDFWVFLRADVPFFFYLGGLARRRGIDVRIGARATLWLVAAYALLTLLRTLAPLVVDAADPTQTLALEVATRLTRPLGVLACWGLAQRLAGTGAGAAVARWGGAAFFLHAAHFPLIEVVKAGLWRLVPAPTDGWMLAHYAASVALTIALCALAAVALFRLSPRLYGVLAGGRRLD